LIEPAPTRGQHVAWSVFLKAHWKAMAASDFFTVEVWSWHQLITRRNALTVASKCQTWLNQPSDVEAVTASKLGEVANAVIELATRRVVIYAECLGKGRKHRRTPLLRETAAVLREWLRERGGAPSDPAFPTRQSRALGHDGLDYLLKKHLVVARRHCPSLKRKHVTLHCLRHYLAMSLLRGGVDPSVIALFVGHEQVETTSVYLHADMQMKEAALVRTSTGKPTVRRYRPGDRLLAFLNGL